MTSIYIVHTMDGNDGRGIVDINYFFLECDAKNFVGKDRYKTLSFVNVWDAGEYSYENVKKQRALAKLTEEDKKALGLI